MKLKELNHAFKRIIQHLNLLTKSRGMRLSPQISNPTPATSWGSYPGTMSTAFQDAIVFSIVLRPYHL